MAKKTDRIVVTLECTEARGLGKTPSRYVTRKNKKNTTQKLELKKYNRYLKKVTVHKEVKS
ncbi:50S ribosomal protein L33 [bacterium]|nr:50S ribosomal protein L33 [bacterium]